MEIEDIFTNEKTLYTIVDEQGEKSTITIDKWAADLLQEMKSNVHEWIQKKYNQVCKKKPELTRLKKGDVVRALARREAESSPHYKSLIDYL